MGPFDALTHKFCEDSTFGFIVSVSGSSSVAVDVADSVAASGFRFGSVVALVMEPCERLGLGNGYLIATCHSYFWASFGRSSMSKQTKNRNEIYRQSRTTRALTVPGSRLTAHGSRLTAAVAHKNAK